MSDIFQARPGGAVYGSASTSPMPWYPGGTAQATAPAAQTVGPIAPAAVHPANTINPNAASALAGLTLTPDQLKQLQGLQGLPTNIPAGLQNMTYPGKLETDQAAAQQQAAQQKAAKPLTAAEKIGQTKKYLNWMLGNLNYQQAYGTLMPAVAQETAKLIATLPSNDAMNFINKHPALKGTGLGTAVSQYAQQVGAAPAQPGAAAAAAKPAYDPLALQTMWHDVFGPAFNQTVKLAGNAGPGYLAGMQKAIAGSNASPAQKQQMMGDAQATAALMQNVAFTPKGQPRAAAQVPFDTLIGNLQQSANAAGMAAGEAQRAVGAAMYGTGTTGLGTAGLGATGITNPLTGLTGGGTTGGISPVESAALLQNSLAGSQTSSSTLSQARATNPYLPNMPGYLP